jgi:hypothetical protein
MGGRACDSARVRTYRHMVAIGALAVAWSCGLAADVPAATVVSGDRDTNAPLVIDPSTSPTGESTVQLSLGPVMFIERMPVTKRVDRVTLGDLSLPPGCANVTANAKISEHQTRDMNTSSAQFYSLSSVPLPASPSKLTWTFSPVTMRKGYGYSFSVSLSGCPQYRQTTWAHNQSQVNPGLLRCTQGPNVNRMWHEAGQEDGQSGCVDPSPSTRKFNSIMPSGWLVSVPAQNGSNVWDVMSFSGQPPVCYTPYYPNKYETYGAEPIAWRTDPFGQTDYTCRWTQFAAFNTPAENLPSDGWYYAQPWMPAPNEGPRDMYLKLETIDYDALLHRYSPVLRFDSESNYWNASPETMVEWSANKLRFQNPVSAPCASFSYFAHPEQGGPDWNMATLVTPPNAYPGTSCVSTTVDEIDAEGDHKQAADAFRYSDLDNRAYGRAIHDSAGRLWLQYWLFYYFNEQNFLGVGQHEGDWEMVQYRLKSDLTPDVATYAQHEDSAAEACLWSQVGRYALEAGGQVIREAPEVYVAAASQASYFVPGTHVRAQRPNDSADGNGEVRNTDAGLVPLGETPSWMSWPGHWGDGGPSSPSHQDVRWNDPQAFHDGASTCSNPDGSPRS